MARLGHEVFIVAAVINRDIYNLDPAIDCISVFNRSAKSPWFWACIPLVVRRMKIVASRLKPDAIIANHFPTNAVLADLGGNGVWMCHEPYPYFHSRNVFAGNVNDLLRARLVSAVYSKYDIKSARIIETIAANSTFTRKEIWRVFGRDSTCVFPGFDENIIGKSYGNRVEGRVLSVSPSTPLKGFEYTLRAFVTLARRGIAKNLRVVGRIYPTYRKMIGRVRRKYPNIRVTVLGTVSREDLYREYSTATLVSYPSIREPFGIVPVEAVALGTPVLYFKSGGLLDTMIDGTTGVGVQVGDVALFIQGMKHLLQNPMRIETSSRRVNRHLRRFTWSRTASDLISLCRGREP